MRIQLYSDLHLETEVFDPKPAPGAEVLVLAGDIDSSWRAYARFANWPVPVLVVAGNHEFDDRDLAVERDTFAAMCRSFGFTPLERQSLVMQDSRQRHIRFLGATRWTDFDLFGPALKPRAIKVGAYFHKIMRSTIAGLPFDAEAARREGEISRRWLADALAEAPSADQPWDATVVITHFAPSLRSGDPRYGSQISTACFCNADDDLLPMADLWLHGHVHCRHDYWVPSPLHGPTRVVSQARGLAAKDEADGFDALKVLEV